MGLILKPWGERDRSDLSIMGELQPKFSRRCRRQRLCHRAFRHSGRCRRDAGRVRASPIPVTIRGLAEVLDKIDAEAKKSGLFIFTNADLRFQTPQVELIVDKDRANKLGVTMQRCRRHAGHPAWRQQRQPLHGAGAQLSGDPAGAADRARERRPDPEATGCAHPMAPWCRCRPSSTISKTVQPNGLATFQQLNSATLQGVPFPGRTVGEARGLPAAEGRRADAAGHGL